MSSKSLAELVNKPLNRVNFPEENLNFARGVTINYHNRNFIMQEKITYRI